MPSATLPPPLVRRGQLLFEWAEPPAAGDALPFRAAPVAGTMDEDRAAALFLKVARARGREVQRVRVLFRPFRATLYSYRILANGTARVKFHSVFRQAPEAALEQALHLMLCRRRAARRRLPRDAYAAFLRSVPPEAFVPPGAPRARPRARPGPGRHRSLEESFARVNARYFGGAMPAPELCWSPVRARRTLATYRESSDRVVVSRRFDSPRVPLHVLDYLMYHELLHKQLGTGRGADGRRRLHGREFRRRERAFGQYDAAMRFLKDFV